MKGWWLRLFVAAGVALAVAALACALALGPFLPGLIGVGGRAAGYRMSYGALHNRLGHLTVVRPDVASLGGEPVFTAERIEVAYDLRHFFGSRHPYGISAVEIERPKVTIVHHRDGTYNVVLPKANATNPAKPFEIPELRIVVKDGSLGLLDETRLFAHSRRLTLEDVQLRGDLDPRRRSTFALRFAILEVGGKYPFSARGTFDETRGYEMAHITARTVAIAPLVDYALNSSSLHIANGILNDVDAHVYGLPDRSGTMRRHLAVTANLDHFQPYLNGLAKPLRDGRGALRVYDDGLAIPKVDGSIAGIPVRIAGAIYDFAKPSLRLGVAGNGDLRRLVTLNDAATKLPLAGNVAFTVFVEGDAAQPTTLAAFRARRITYGRFPIDAPQGLVALSGADTSILRASASYAGIVAGARGNLRVDKKHTGVEVVTGVDLPAQRLPYAAALLGSMHVRADALISGVDAHLSASGVVAGSTRSERLGGRFSLDGSGVGTIGPLALDGPGSRELFARVVLDAPRGQGGAAFVQARGFSLSTRGPQPALPGVDLANVPEVDGTLDADVAGAFARRQYALGGTLHAYGVHVRGFPVDDVSARGSLADGRLAVEARYRGSLADVARAAGSTVAIRGRADIPVSLVATAPGAAIAQIHEARFEGARIGSVSLDDLQATVGLRGRAIDVYAAQARLGGNDVVAQGSFGNGGTLQVSAAAIDLAPLRAAGLPVRSGTLTALAAVGGTTASPRVEGGVAADDVTLRDAAYAGLAVSASSGFEFAGDALSLHDALVRAGPAVASLDGSVRGLRRDPERAHYAFEAHVRQADIGTLARVARAPLRYPEGTLDADVHVAGSGKAPAVRGTIAIPEGSLNGLRFRDATVALAGTPSALQARGGRVTVGSSTIGFSADISPRAQRAAVRAGRLELSDFNDYFDRGDTLGGNGNVDLAVRSEPGAIVTSGNVRLAHTRVRRFDIGDTRAQWFTTGRTVHSSVALGSSAGRVSLRGDVVLPQTQPLRDTFYRSRLALDATVEDIDLATWLPAAGFQAPVLGLVDATATIRGIYPRAAVRAHADLQRGLVSGIALRTASLDLRATGGSATVTSAVLALDNLSASAKGSLGISRDGPVDLTVAAQSADVGALAKTLTGKTYDASGAVQTTAHVTGTLRRLVAGDVLDAQMLRYGRFTLDRAHAVLALTPTLGTLRESEFDLHGGRLLASGFVPLRTKPTFGIGPREAPLQLGVTAERIDLAQFADLLEKGTQVAGTLDGRVAVVGSLAHPGLDGTLALANGSFSGPQEREKVSAATAQLTLRDRTATLHDTSAAVGGGTVFAGGSASVPDLTDPLRSASVNLQASSDGAVFNLPQYFRGRVNGTVTVVRTPAATPVVGGQLTFTSTRIPTSALQQSKPADPTATGKLPDVAFNLAVNAGSDVRVQGGPVDIGAQGSVVVGGTLAAPTVAGQLDSTGGTISFYRTFRLQYPSTLQFEADNGITPTVDATATTTVDNPPTDVTLHVTGPTTQLNVALSSDPNYSREQILGLLVGAQTFGAVSGIQTSGSGGPQQNPFQAAAEGQLGTLLTQNILEPFSSQLGSAVGLNNLAINYTPGGGASVGAQKKIFKNVNAVFAQSFNYPPRESIGLLASPNDATAIQLTFFSQPSSNRFNTFEGAQSLQSSNNAVTSTQPANGTSGFSFSFQRKFP